MAVGAEVVISASYQAPDALLAESVRIARRAGVLVAASVAPYGASLAGGQEYTGDYDVPPGWHERRVGLIVMCDCGCDADYRFGDLANLIRLARIDFGLEIVVDRAAADDVELGAVFGVPEDFGADASAGASSKLAQTQAWVTRSITPAPILRIDVSPSDFTAATAYGALLDRAQVYWLAG